MQNGWHALSDEEYNNIDALRSSDLSKLLRSPLHFSMKQPFTSPALQMGSLIHLMTLTPGDVCHRVKVLSSSTRTKAGKEELATLGKDMLGVTQEDFDKASAISNAVLSHPIAAKALTNGVAEIAGVFNGMKIKPDYRRFDGIICDLKTTLDASQAGFAKSVVNYNYAMQAAYYLDLANNICKTNYHTWLWIAVEKEPPYAVAVYAADKETLEFGRTRYKRALDIYNAAKASGQWVGYPEVVTTLKLPPWGLRDDN